MVEVVVENVEVVVDKVVDEVGVVVEQVVDEVLYVVDQVVDVVVIVVDDVVGVVEIMGGEVVEIVVDVVQDVEEVVLDVVDLVVDVVIEGQVVVLVMLFDVKLLVIFEVDLGVLGIWIILCWIWIMNQLFSQEWDQFEVLDECFVEWQDIVKVNDMVLDDLGQVVGYIVDIGGFLGIGVKKVLLGVDVIYMVMVGMDIFFVINYIKVELEVLFDFDEKIVCK